MSLGARIVIALVSGLFGALMVAVAPEGDKAPMFYAFAAFCFAISVACLAPGRISEFFGSLVAAGILMVGLFYFVSMLVHGPVLTGRRSEQSLVNSLLFLIAYAVPAAAYLRRARFGFRRVQSTSEAERGSDGVA